MGAFCVFGFLKEDIEAINHKVAFAINRRQSSLKVKVYTQEEIKKLAQELHQRFTSKLRKKPCSPEFGSPHPCSNYINLLKNHSDDVIDPKIYFRWKNTFGDMQRTFEKYVWVQELTQQSIVRVVGKILATQDQ